MTAQMVFHDNREPINAHFYVPNGRDGDIHNVLRVPGQLWERVAESTNHYNGRVSALRARITTERIVSGDERGLPAYLLSSYWQYHVSGVIRAGVKIK